MPKDAPEGTGGQFLPQNSHVAYQNEADDTRSRLQVICHSRVKLMCYTVQMLLVNAGIKIALLTEG